MQIISKDALYMNKKFSFFKSTFFSIAIIVLLLFSLIFLWVGAKNSTQAASPSIAGVSFQGEYQIGDGYATYLRDNNGVDELAFFEEDILAALAGTLNASNAKFAYDFVKNGSIYTATKLSDWLIDNGGIYAYCYTDGIGTMNTSPRTFINYLSYCVYNNLTPGRNVKGTAGRIEVCTSDHLCSIAVLSFAK